MVKELLTRTQFAARCGVSPAAITKACSAALRDACDGKRIDGLHPAAVAYQEKVARMAAPVDPLAEGIDGRYQEAVDLCNQLGRYTASTIQRGLNVGYERAVKLLTLMRAAGVVPDGVVDEPPPGDEEGKAKPPAAKEPHTRGTAAARQKKINLPFDPNDVTVEIPEDIEQFADLSLRELIKRFGTAVRFLDWLRALKEIEAVNEKRIKNAQNQGRLVSRVLVESGVIDVFNSAHLRLMTDGAKTLAASIVAKHKAGAEGPEIEHFAAEVVGSFIRPVKKKISRALREAVEADGPED